MTSYLSLSNIKWLALATITALFVWTQSQLQEVRALRRLDAQTYKTEQLTATLKFNEEKAKLEKKYEKDAEIADNSVHDLLGKYNAALLRAKASQSGGQRPEGASQGNSATVLDGPSEDTKLLISGKDAYICAENTARLQVSREWALKLNDPVQ
jgi:hypothetical protein